MNERKVYKDALETWGAEAQTKMLFEEIGELMQAVCKASRVDNWEKRMEVWHNIAEEIADVKIMLGQMEILFDVEDAVEACGQEKITRLAKRLEAAHAKAEEKEKHCQECICPSCDLFQKTDCLEGADHCAVKCDHESHTRACPWHPNEREGQT